MSLSPAPHTGINTGIPQLTLNVKTIKTQGAFQLKPGPLGQAPTCPVQFVGSKKHAAGAQLLQRVLRQGSYPFRDETLAEKAAAPPIAHLKLAQRPVGVVQATAAHQLA